jgi:hypothetical protein
MVMNLQASSPRGRLCHHRAGSSEQRAQTQESDFIMSGKQEAAQNPHTFGRYAEIPTEQLSAAQKEAYDFIMQARGMCPGPYRIWLQNAKLLKAMTPIGVYFQKEMQISKVEREIVTNCINGKWATAGYSNGEHEKLGEQVGLSTEKVAALIALARGVLIRVLAPAGLWKAARRRPGDARTGRASPASRSGARHEA